MLLRDLKFGICSLSGFPQRRIVISWLKPEIRNLKFVERRKLNIYFKIFILPPLYSSPWHGRKIFSPPSKSVIVHFVFLGQSVTILLRSRDLNLQHVLQPRTLSVR